MDRASAPRPHAPADPAPAAGIRVLIVDDQGFSRNLIRGLLEADRRVTVVGEAADATAAREAIRHLRPDVLTLDVEMPGMDGLSFLERLMRLRPMPVIMISSHTGRGSAAAVRALSLGAVECYDRSGLGTRRQTARCLVDSVVMAARTRPPPLRPADHDPPPPGRYRWNGRLLLAGASTGGVEALERAFAVFPADGPPTVVAQHMPAPFLASFAARLAGRVRPAVRLARHGERLERGTIYIAPGGDTHCAVDWRHEAFRARLIRSHGDDWHVPSVDILFRSALPHAPRMTAVLLTGMGRDGAAGLHELRRAGARTLAQSADSCLIDGMPKAARTLGAVERSVAIDGLGAALLDACARQPVADTR